MPNISFYVSQNKENQTGVEQHGMKKKMKEFVR